MFCWGVGLGSLQGPRIHRRWSFIFVLLLFYVMAYCYVIWFIIFISLDMRVISFMMNITYFKIWKISRFASRRNNSQLSLWSVFLGCSLLTSVRCLQICTSGCTLRFGWPQLLCCQETVDWPKATFFPFFCPNVITYFLQKKIQK